MPRAPRLKSASGIYHIMFRGINRQTIFEDDEDYVKFIETLKSYKSVSGYKVFAYCLMSNHIHILLKAEKEDLDLIIKRIAGSYVYWYNRKYYRTGHLFQDRFKSEPVEDDKYFLTVLRYIHQNPVKAGRTEDVSEYKYSSYNEYVNNRREVIDKDFVYSIIDEESFIKYNNEDNEDECLEIDNLVFRLSDKDARKEIKRVSGCESTTEFQMLAREERDKCIKKLRKNGLSIRQISRLTGISKGVIEKI